MKNIEEIKSQYGTMRAYVREHVMRNHAGREVTLNQLTNELDIHRNVISSIMSDAIRREDLPGWSSPHQGVYKYTPSEDSSGTPFIGRIVGQRQNGDLLVEVGDKLYTCREV